ncbi:protein EFFECTOR OF TRANSCRIPTION 2 [Sesamum indicum]|uniref:Protein EFFECTOR OF TRANSCRIPTION 2 n=1 Tax=Sesamum indicum TaxID=4182 RepID=A0A6I9U8E7_SESIN|nr:protein EFFECTOR OF TRANSCRIPTION 2 [Sesamum indicum]
MGVPTSSATSTTAARLKREDFRRTKHDSAFSQWKILIGAHDWQDHSMGKEGAEKYRTQNLPNWISCPGVYELGIATSRPRSGREARKLESSSVVPVYLGQADNLRTRLQQYGRDGAHLENGCSNNKLRNFQGVSSSKEPGLFIDVFSRGLPIVYRCAPMKSKKDAEITEKQLLDKFDYAWNKGSNGGRRHDDICRKLDSLAKSSQFSYLAKKLLSFNQKKVGIKIRTYEPCVSKDGSNLSNMDNNVTISRIFGIKRLQPTKLQYGSDDNCSDICGVAVCHGSVCTTPPVKGRKRCAIHKGMRVNGYISKLNAEGKGPSVAVNVGSSIRPNRLSADLQDPRLTHSREIPNNEIFAPICGFILDDGSPCKMKPLQRNKRCLEHKGRRIRVCQPKKFVTEG